jgi:hypothetical protein
VAGEPLDIAGAIDLCTPEDLCKSPPPFRLRARRAARWDVSQSCPARVHSTQGLELSHYMSSQKQKMDLAVPESHLPTLSFCRRHLSHARDVRGDL